MTLRLGFAGLEECVGGGASDELELGGPLLGRGFGLAGGARDGRRFGAGERLLPEARCGELAAGKDAGGRRPGVDAGGREKSGIGAWVGCEGSAFGVVCSVSSLPSVLVEAIRGGGGIAARSLATLSAPLLSTFCSVFGAEVAGGGGIAARSLAALSAVRSALSPSSLGGRIRGGGGMAAASLAALQSLCANISGSPSSAFSPSAFLSLSPVSIALSTPPVLSWPSLRGPSAGFGRSIVGPGLRNARRKCEIHGGGRTITQSTEATMRETPMTAIVGVSSGWLE